MEERKPNRWKCHDYSSCGSYFVTICTKDKEKMFWVGAPFGRPPKYLNEKGIIVENEISKLNNVYPGIVTVDRYAIMPNHIHLLLTIHPDKEGRPQGAPTISRVINQFKGSVSKQIGRSVWQKLFHDRVVRNDDEYYLITQYIIDNPSRWSEDKYFI